MKLEPTHLYKFGEFDLDKKEKILRRNDVSIGLTPKVFELLTFFVENQGRLIEKDEIMQKLWADSFVEESNLTFNIRQLRKILNDTAQNPTYIETVWGHGYRFIAQVTEVTETNIPAITEESFPEIIFEEDEVVEKPPQKSKVYFRFTKLNKSPWLFNSYLPTVIIIILLLSSLAVALIVRKNWTDSGSNAPILNAKLKSEQLTNAGGVYEAAISPDGKRMVYSLGIGGKTGIWVKQFESGENIQIIPNTEDAYYGLAFSNDSQDIFFLRGPRTNEAKKISIYRISVLGGIPKELINDAEAAFSLSPDNKQISFVRCPRTDEDYCSLYIADNDGTNVRKLLTRQRPLRIRDNQFSPDGKSIALAVGETRSNASEFGLVEINIETKVEREITKHKFSNIKYLRWLPDNRSLLITAFEPPNDSVKIFKVSTTENEVQVLTKDSPINFDVISLDKEAKKMVATQITSNYRVWTIPLKEPKTETPLSQAAEAMYFGQSGLAFTPSGKIVYDSAADSNQHIWVMNADGTNQRQLTSGQGANWQPRLSPDESFILFASNRSGTGQIWRMNIDGTNQTQITNDPNGSRPIRISSDGTTIYYESARDATIGKLTIGQDGKYISSTISEERVFQPEFSPDEKTIAYFSRKPKQPFQISLMSANDGKILKSFSFSEERAFPIKVVWSADSNSLFYLCKNDKRTMIWQQSLAMDKAEMIADLGEEDVSDFALSPDGRSFAFIRGKSLHDAFLITGLK